MQWIPQAFIQATEWALSLLPNSPFLFLDNYDTRAFNQYFRWFNWFVPVGSILGIMTAWCTAILIYYAVQVVLRWARAIQ